MGPPQPVSSDQTNTHTSPSSSSFQPPSVSPSIKSLLNAAASSTSSDPLDYFSTDAHFEQDEPEQQVDDGESGESSGRLTARRLSYADEDVGVPSEGNGRVGRGLESLLSPAPASQTTTTTRMNKRPRTESFDLRATEGEEGGGRGGGGEMRPPLGRGSKSFSPKLETTPLPRRDSTEGRDSTASMETGRPSAPPSNVSSYNSSSSSSSSHSAPLPAPTALRPQDPFPTSHLPSTSRPQRLEPSVFMVEPIDEFTREVADWIWGFCRNLPPEHVEIEAKLGVLVDRHTNSRYRLPVPIETILTDAGGLRFESNMTINQHKTYNNLLNSRVVESASDTYPHAPIRYSHTKEIDSFHDSPSGKLRVTRDGKGDVKAVVSKGRIADMNVYSPKRVFDWRLSINTEIPSSSPPTPSTHTRQKDRISYSHQNFLIDLTQVTTTPTSSAPTHELEIEFKDARVLLEEGGKEERGEENVYLELVQCFLNNIRLLIRNAADS